MSYGADASVSEAAWLLGRGSRALGDSARKSHFFAVVIRGRDPSIAELTGAGRADRGKKGLNPDRGGPTRTIS